MEQKTNSKKIISHVATKAALCNSLVPLRKSAFTLAEGRLACTTTQATAKAAFTLAEVLITLAIIGVVAVLTVPALIQNYNEKAWSTAQSVFEKRLEVAVKQLNTEEKLAGYSSTMDFINELKNKIKITKVCDSSHLTDCFAKSIVNASGVEYDISELASSRFTKENWGTETVGVQFANGVNALIAYNPNTKQDPYNNQFGATAESMAILYDVSGYKNPNTIGKDINMNGNVKALGCMIKPELLGGMCINQILAPGTGYSPMTYDECRQAVTEGTLGISACYRDPDYWAGAVRACDGTDNMPSESQLTALANYLYNRTDITSDNYTNSLAMDMEKASQFLAVSLYSDNFHVWSGQSNDIFDACTRHFDSAYTVFACNITRSNSDGLAVCVDN